MTSLRRIHFQVPSPRRATYRQGISPTDNTHCPLSVRCQPPTGTDTCTPLRSHSPFPPANSSASSSSSSTSASAFLPTSSSSLVQTLPPSFLPLRLFRQPRFPSHALCTTESRARTLLSSVLRLVKPRTSAPARASPPLEPWSASPARPGFLTTSAAPPFSSYKYARKPENEASDCDDFDYGEKQPRIQTPEYQEERRPPSVSSSTTVESSVPPTVFSQVARRALATPFPAMSTIQQLKNFIRHGM